MSYSPDPNSPWWDKSLKKIKALNIQEIDNLGYADEIDWRLISTHCIYKFQFVDKVTGAKWEGWITDTHMNNPIHVKERFTYLFKDVIKKRPKLPGSS